jgi:hypothetical protein
MSEDLESVNVSPSADDDELKRISEDKVERSDPDAVELLEFRRAVQTAT